MHQLLANTVVLTVLAILTYFDIKYRKIPAIWLGLLAAAEGAEWIVTGDYANPVRYLGILAGLVFCALSVLSRQAVGLGDALLFTILGGYLGIYQLLLLLFGAFCATAAFSVGLLACRKGNLKTILPFLPFLYIAFGGMCLI